MIFVSIIRKVVSRKWNEGSSNYWSTIKKAVIYTSMTTGPQTRLNLNKLMLRNVELYNSDER